MSHGWQGWSCRGQSREQVEMMSTIPLFFAVRSYASIFEFWRRLTRTTGLFSYRMSLKLGRGRGVLFSISV